jgi:HEAT repeat protein
VLLNWAFDEERNLPMPLRYLTAILVAASLLAGCSKSPPTPDKPTETKPLTLNQLEARQTELLGLVKAGKRDERIAALKELPNVVSNVSGRTGGGVSPPLPVEVVEAMGDPDPRVRKAAAEACRQFHGETAPTVKESTRQSDYKIEGTDAVATLASVLGRRSPVLRKAAADALGRIGPPAAKAIPALAATEDDALRGAVPGRVGVYLGTMEENMEVVRAVTAALKAIDPDGKVAEAAKQEVRRRRLANKKAP